MNNKAFTLIELLVVVLIIGILAAIAVPQYQKAVGKSRAMQLITASKSLAEANRAYYLQNGTYTKKFENLDINFGNVKGGNLQITSSTGCNLQFDPYVYCFMSSPYISILRYYNPDILVCYSYNDDNYKGDDLCKMLTNKTNYIPGCGKSCHVYSF